MIHIYVLFEYGVNLHTWNYYYYFHLCWFFVLIRLLYRGPQGHQLYLNCYVLPSINKVITITTATITLSCPRILCELQYWTKVSHSLWTIGIKTYTRSCLSVELRWLDRLKNDDIRQKYDAFRNIIFKALEHLQKALMKRFCWIYF